MTVFNTNRYDPTPINYLSSWPVSQTADRIRRPSCSSDAPAEFFSLPVNSVLTDMCTYVHVEPPQDSALLGRSCYRKRADSLAEHYPRPLSSGKPPRSSVRQSHWFQLNSGSWESSDRTVLCVCYILIAERVIWASLRWTFFSSFLFKHLLLFMSRFKTTQDRNWRAWCIYRIMMEN